MSHTISTDGSTAVATGEFWLPLKSAPIGVKVQGLTLGRVGCYTVFTKAALSSGDYIAWAPMPKEPEWLKDAYNR